MHTLTPYSEQEPSFTDPVCGMQVRPDGPHRLEHDGTEYRFCCASCKDRLAADPERYLNPAPATEGEHEAPSPSGKPGGKAVRYTCPMHPEIVQDGPGSCPKCGMALEPQGVELEEDTSELDDMTRRFWISVALAFPVFLSAMTAEFWPDAIDGFLQPRYRQ